MSFGDDPALSGYDRNFIYRLTRNVGARMSAYVPGGSRVKSFRDLNNLSTIDRYLYAGMDATA